VCGWQILRMAGWDLVLVLRYRKAVTYGFHALLGALGQHETTTRYEVRFGESTEETARHIREAGDVRTLVLWSFHSPDAAAPAHELKQIRALADGPNVTHLAGGGARDRRAGADAGRGVGHGRDRRAARPQRLPGLRPQVGQVQRPGDHPGLYLRVPVATWTTTCVFGTRCRPAGPSPLGLTIDAIGSAVVAG
jgi:hypothetical protein